MKRWIEESRDDFDQMRLDETIAKMKFDGESITKIGYYNDTYKYCAMLEGLLDTDQGLFEEGITILKRGNIKISVQRIGDDFQVMTYEGCIERGIDVSKWRDA